MSLDPILAECLLKTPRKGAFYTNGSVLIEERPVTTGTGGTTQVLILENATEETLREFFQVPKEVPVVVPDEPAPVKVTKGSDAAVGGSK